MNTIECPACGEMIPDDSRFCDMCGVELLQCVNCGTIGTDSFCPECGKPMIARKGSTSTAATEPDSPESEPMRDPAPDPNCTTGGGRRKSVVLKARNGNFILRPEDEAIIGRKDSPYEQHLASLDLISRRHGKFVKRGRDWYIVDFGSTNGTLVNDVELDPNVPAKIAPGDVVDIGTYLFDVIER